MVFSVLTVPMAGCLVFSIQPEVPNFTGLAQALRTGVAQGLRCTEQGTSLAVPFVPKSLLLKAKRQCGPWTTLGKLVTSENCALVRLLPFSLRLEAVYNAMACHITHRSVPKSAQCCEHRASSSCNGQLRQRWRGSWTTHGGQQASAFCHLPWLPGLC